MSDVQELMREAQAAGKVRRYVKYGLVHARPAGVGERVVTMVAGEQETTNTAKPNDMVVTGRAGERYLIGRDKFEARYQLVSRYAKTNDGLVFKPTGECWAFEYRGASINFQAPWGEPMVLHNRDYLATTALGSTDIYRIERSVFKDTYREQRD